jgi:hypothetical protein
MPIIAIVVFSTIHAAALFDNDHDCGDHHCMEVRAAVTAKGGGATGKWKDDVTPKRVKWTHLSRTNFSY